MRRVEVFTKKIIKYGLLSFAVLFLVVGCGAFTPPPPMVQTGMDDFMMEPESDADAPMAPTRMALPPLKATDRFCNCTPEAGAPTTGVRFNISLISFCEMVIA